MNNSIEQYNIWLTHAFIPKLKSPGQDEYPENEEKKEVIEDQIKKTKKNFEQLKSQVDDLDNMGGLTDDQQAEKTQSYQQLLSMINQQSRKIEQHQDKFMRFCKDGNQKIQDKVKEDKDE